MRRTVFWAFVVAVVSLTLVLAAGCGQKESSAESRAEENAVKPVKVSVVTVEPTSIRDVLALPGETRPWQDVRLAADQGGQVEWLGPREGDEVRKGDLVAKIDVSALKAALENAEAAARLAEEVYQRRQRLFERKIITEEELDRSRAERDVARGNLRQARVHYEQGFVRAPIDGFVNYLFVDEGEFVGRGEPVADLVKVKKIEIEVNVPELDVRYLRVGQEAGVRVDAFPERRFLGRIDFVAYKADPATKTFRVKVLLDNPAGQIRPGMIARLVFIRRVIPEALVAPLFALVDKGGERLVFVEEDGRAHARTVSVGVINGDRVQITEGLSPGDRLIVRGQNQVEEGMRVQVQ